MEVVLDDLDRFPRQWQRPWLIPFAEDPELRLGELKILELEIERFLGAQAVEQHEGDQSQIAEGTKATPKLRNLIGGQWHDHAVRLFEPKPSGHPAAWTAIAQRRLSEIGALEAMRSRGQRTSGMKPIQGTEHAQAMVDGLRSWLRIFLELITDIVE